VQKEHYLEPDVVVIIGSSELRRKFFFMTPLVQHYGSFIILQHMFCGRKARLSCGTMVVLTVLPRL